MTTAVCIIGFLYFSLLLLVSLPDARIWMACKFRDFLANAIGCRVEVSAVALNLFNSASVENLVIYDRHNEKMLDIGKVDIAFECLPLLNGTLRLSSIKARDGELRLYKKSEDSDLNCQFVIDSLASKDTEGGLEIQIGSLVAKNMRLYYDILDKSERKSFVDENHIAADNVNCSLLFKSLNRDDFFMRVRNLEFCLKSGFSVKHFCASANATNRDNALCINLKGGTFVYGDIRSTLHKSHLLVNTKKQKPPSLSSLAEVGLNMDVETGNRHMYSISASVAKSHKDTECPVEVSLALRHGGRPLAKVHAFTSFWPCRRMHGEYSVDLDRKDLDPILNAFNVDIPSSAYIDKLSTMEQKASFRIDGTDFVWKGLVRTSLGEFAHDVRKEGERVSYDLGLKDFELPIINGVHDLKVTSATLNGVALSKQVAGLPFADLFKVRMPKDLTLCSKIAVDGLQSSVFNISHTTLSVSLDRGIADIVADVADSRLKLHSVVRCNVPRLSEALHESLTRAERRGSEVQVPLPVVSARASVDYLDAELLKPLADKMALVSFGAKDVEILFTDSQNFLVGIDGYSCRYKDGRSKTFGKLSLACSSSSGVCKYDLRSDSCTGQLVTDLGLNDIAALCRQQLSAHFPALVNGKRVMESTGESNGFANLKIKAQPGSFVSEFLREQVEMDSPVYIDARVSGNDRRSVLTAVAPRLKYNGASYGGISLYYNNNQDSLTGAVMFTKLLGEDSVRVESSFAGSHDILRNELKWKTGDGSGTRGSVITRTSLTRDGSGHLCCRMKVLPGRFFVGDTVWNISPADILYCGNSLTVDKFRVSRQNQYLNFSTAVSDSTKDVLLELNDVEVAYILELLDFKPVEFSGRAFGVVRNLGDGNLMNANLTVRNFCFNTGFMGTLDLRGRVDLDRENIELKAKTYSSPDDSTLINGVIDVGNNKLDLSIKSEKTNLQFLNKYVRGFVSDLEGTVSGDFRLFGDLKYLNMEGRHRVNYMKFRPKMLGVLYTFENDSLHIRPDTIDFGGMVLRDPYGNSANVSGSLNHHSLFDFDYKLNFDLNGLQLIDWGKSPSRSFGGKIFTEGDVGIYGDFDRVHIGGELSTSGSPGTSVLYYSSESVSSEEENSYIRFVDKQDRDNRRAGKEERRGYSLRDNSTDVHIKFKLNVNPNATLNIVTDPTTNDLMALNGSGALSLDYYNKGRFLVNGLYTIDGGDYKLTIKDIIRKNFVIQPGGYLRFNGGLSDGDINIKGIHKINSVSLSDLNVGASYSNSTIGADCILNFTGKMSEPKVSFGLDFPNANSDENEIIKNILLTEEDRNLQAVYLLSIGRFYTYNYNSFNSSGQSQSSVAMTSFLAGTLSGQVNNLLQDAFHIDNWNFDTNIAAGRMGWDDMEVQGSLSGKMFDNRLLFNGNIGYRDQITTYSNNFVGNFNLRWFLNRSGSISLKAYSETNDRYFTKSTLTTQGGGIMFRKDFDKLRFFFKPKR